MKKVKSRFWKFRVSATNIINSSECSKKINSLYFVGVYLLILMGLLVYDLVQGTNLARVELFVVGFLLLVLSTVQQVKGSNGNE